MIKSLVLKLIGEENAGRLDYLLNRKSKDAWGPLNGQAIRQRVYSEIIKRIEFRAIVETGTFRGTTTEYFSKTGLPVYTVEIHPRAYGYAAQRFARAGNQIHVYHGDSPDFLRRLAKDPNCPKSKVFFYLDAHVQDSSKYFKAPLVEELEIIFTNWTHPVIMIDDFHVPGTAYSFDDWGDPAKNLCLEAFSSLNGFGFSAFFPTLDPKEETGAKRGWVVLCREDGITKTLAGIADLRSAGCMV